jgi:hypothetical protein
LALFSLGAEPTEQKIFKLSNRQVESLDLEVRLIHAPRVTHRSGPNCIQNEPHVYTLE